MTQALSKLLSNVETFSGSLREHLASVGDWIEAASELERELVNAFRVVKAEAFRQLGDGLSVANVEQLLLESIRRELTPEAVRDMAHHLARSVARLHAEKEETQPDAVQAPMSPPPVTDSAPPVDAAPPVDLAAMAQARAGGPAPVPENVEENAPSEPATGASPAAE